MKDLLLRLLELPRLAEDSLARMLSTAPNRLEHPSLAVGGVRIAVDEPLGRSLVRLVLTQFNAGPE